MEEGPFVPRPLHSPLSYDRAVDLLFVFGAVVIGSRTQNWGPVAVGLLQLTAVALLAIGVAQKAIHLVVVGDIAYLAAIGGGFFFYLKGRSLAKTDDKREPCELIGASATLGLIGLVVGIVMALR